MASVKNDEEEQLFFNKDLLREAGAQTTLMGVVDSRSFAGSEADYFVGKGGLAGIIGVPPAPFEGISACVNERWTLLREKAGLQEAQKEASQPLFCWVDSVCPVIAAGAQKAGWLKVDDVVGSPSPESKDGNPLIPSVPQAGLALLLKICGALADMSYPPEVVDSVGALVKRNLMTAVHSESLPLETQSSPGDEEWTESRVAAVLACMLDSKMSRTRSFNVNSNEPVLLINNFGELGHELVRKIVSVTMELLHQVWNVWPVRVYAGPFMIGQVSDEYRQIGFSITLLNVVNTDMGGPSASLSYFRRICRKMTGVRFHKIESMIDLLDHASDAPIWSYSFNSFFKEVWRDGQLIEKFETEAPISRSSSSDSISQRSEASLVSEAAVPKEEPLQSHKGDEDLAEGRRPEVQDLQNEAAVFAPIEAEAAETAGIRENFTATADAPVDAEIVWDDIRAQYDSLNVGRSVDHPTFEHPTRRESLLDLIQSQAESAGKPADIEEMEDALKSTVQRTSSSNEDEFVVV